MYKYICLYISNLYVASKHQNSFVAPSITYATYYLGDKLCQYSDYISDENKIEKPFSLIGCAMIDKSYISQDSGPLGYVLWCCGSRSWEVFTYFQIGSGHTVIYIDDWQLPDNCLTTRRLVGSTDQAYSSGFYFRIAWKSMKQPSFLWNCSLSFLRGLKSTNIK